MNKKTLHNIALFCVFIICCVLATSCPTSPIIKTVSLNFSSDSGVDSIIIDGQKKTLSNSEYTYSAREGSSVTFEIKTRDQFRIKSISDQVRYMGASGYQITPKNDTAIRIETVKAAAIDSSSLFVRADEGIETVTFIQALGGASPQTQYTQTQEASNKSMCFEKYSSSDSLSIVIRPKNGYKIASVKGANLADSEHNLYSVTGISNEIVITSSPDSSYVNDYQTIIINPNGGFTPTSVIFYKDGKYYSNNKDGSEEITTIDLPVYNPYIVSFNVSEKDIIIVSSEGEESTVPSGSVIDPYSVNNYCNGIILPDDGSSFVTVSEDKQTAVINITVAPSKRVQEYTAVVETESVTLPSIKQTADPETKIFAGWTIAPKLEDVVPNPYMPKYSITLYDKWEDVSYKFNVSISGDNYGTVKKGSNTENEYNKGENILSKQNPLIFRIVPSEGFTYTYKLTDAEGRDIIPDSITQNQGYYVYTLNQETIRNYDEINLSVKFGNFPSVVLSGDIKLVNNVNIDNFNNSPEFYLTVDENDVTKDKWNTAKLTNGIDITENVVLTLADKRAVPLTSFGESLQAFLTSDGSDTRSKRAIVTIKGSPDKALPSSNVNVINLSMGLLFGKTDSDTITVTSTASLQIKESVKFIFTPFSDDQGVKNRLNKVIAHGTELLKERTIDISEGGSIEFSAEKDINLQFTPLFETGYSLASESPFMPENITNPTDVKDKFNIYASLFESENRITVSSRTKSIRLFNTSVKLDYKTGDTSSRKVELNLVNEGFEIAENITGVLPEIYAIINASPVSIRSKGFTWKFEKSAQGFNITIYPESSLTASLVSSTLKIVIPSSAFKGETENVEVLDISQDQNLVIYPSASVSGSLKAVQNINVSEMKTAYSLTLTSNTALSKQTIGEDGYDVTPYITLADGRALTELGSTFNAKLYTSSNAYEGNIKLEGIIPSELSLSNLSLSFKADIFAGFENDETLIDASSSASLEVLQSVKLTFVPSSESQDKGKLSKVILSESEYFKERTLIIPPDGERKAEVYFPYSQALKFSLEFEELYSLDLLSPFTPVDVVTILSAGERRFEISSDKMTQDREITVASAFKNVTIENTSLDLTYSVGDTPASEKVFTLLSTGYITSSSLTGIVPSVTVKRNNEDVSVTSLLVGGKGFNVNLQKRTDNIEGFILTLSPKDTITSSFSMSDLSITIPKAAFVNAESDIKVVLTEAQKFVIYPTFSAEQDIIAVKGIGEDLAASSRTFVLSSPSVWSDIKVGADENNGIDITDRVLINEQSISAYNLSAYISFITGSNTKTRAAVTIKGEPSSQLATSNVSFNIDSSFFAGFENTSHDVKNSSTSTLTINDSVVFTVQASAETQGTTDNLLSVVVAATDNIKQRTLDIAGAENKTISINVEKDKPVVFKPSFVEGYALDNTVPFMPSDVVTSETGYVVPSSLLAADCMLVIKTIQREVFVESPLNLVFNVGDDSLVKQQIPLVVKGYVVKDELPSSVAPEVYVTILNEETKSIISSTVVGGRGFNAVLKKGEGDNTLVVELSPKQKLTSSYKISTISISLPSVVFKNEEQKVSVTGENINNARFVVYPSTSTSSAVKLIQNVDSANLSTSPVIKVQSDTKWNSAVIPEDGLDVSDKVLLGDGLKSISEYGDSLSAILSIDPAIVDGKTALIKINGTPTASTNELAETLTIRLVAGLFEGFDSDDTIVRCLSQNASVLIDKSTMVTFRADSTSDATNRLRSVGISADGIVEKTLNLENLSVSLYVKNNKNVNFSLEFEEGYSASPTPFALSEASVVNSGDLKYPYRTSPVGKDNITVTVTSIKKEVVVSQSTPAELAFRAAESTISDVKNILVSVNGYKLKDDITGIEPLVYASVNGADVLLTSEELCGVGFNTSMQKRTDGTVGLTFKISPKKKIVSYLERSSIRIVVPSSAFVGESEDVTVLGLENTYIVAYPSVSASLTATFVQNVVTSSLNNAPFVTLKSDAVWNIPENGVDVKDIISFGNSPSTIFFEEGDYSALLVKDESDASGKSAIVNFSGTPKTALSAITSLKYAFDTSFFEGQFTDASSSSAVSVFVTDNSSKVIIYPSYKVTFKLNSQNEDSGKLQSIRILKSENIKESEVLTFDTSLPVANRSVSVYLQKSKVAKALLTFEDGYSLSPSNAYEPTPSITITGLGTEGSPMTIGDGVLTADTVIVVSSIKRGIYLTSVNPSIEQGKSIEYRIGDNTAKTYEFNIKMDGYQKNANPIGNARVMIRRSNGELVDITSTEIGGTGFMVSTSLTSATYDFIVTIRPTASLTASLSDGTIVIYLPATYIKDAVSEIEVVGGDALRSFKIYPSINISGNVKLVNNIPSDMLLKEQELTLTSQTPFNTNYIATHSDVTSLISVGSNKLSDYGDELRATMSVSPEDASGKTAKIIISGTSTLALTSPAALSASFTPSYFEGFAETDSSYINVTSTSRFEISESVLLTFSKGEGEEKGKTIGVTVLGTSTIKEKYYALSSASSVSMYVEKGNALSFIPEYGYSYYIDSSSPFITTPDITIVKDDSSLYSYRIPINALLQDTQITINTIKQSVQFESISAPMSYKIGDGNDKKTTIVLKANGLIIKNDISGIKPVVSAVVNGQKKDITDTVGGKGFKVEFTKREDADGFNLVLSPLSALNESLVNSPLEINLPVTLFENATSDYDVENLGSQSIIIYPSAHTSGRVEGYLNQAIAPVTYVSISSETQWNQDYINNNRDITSIVSIGNDKTPLTNYGSSLKASIAIDSESSGKTAIVTFSGVPEVYLKSETVMNFAFSAMYFTGFDDDSESITTLSSVMFTITDPVGEQLPPITE